MRRQVAAAEARIGDAEPSVVAADDAEARRDPGQRLRARPAGPVLPHLRRARRRPAPTSSMRASTPPATAWRSTICWSRTRSGRPYADRRLRARLVKAVEAALTRGDAARRPRRRRCRAAEPRSRSRRRWSIAEKASTRTTVVEVNARDRRGPARPPGARHPRRRACSVHSAHIATYGERAVDVFYLTRSRREEADGADDRRRCARRCSPRRARQAQPRRLTGKRAPPSGEALAVKSREPQPRSGAGGGGGGGGGGGQVRVARITVPSGQVCVAGGGGGGGGGGGLLDHRRAAPAPNLPRRVRPKVRGSPRKAPNSWVERVTEAVRRTARRSCPPPWSGASNATCMIILVEQVLRPQLDRPALVAAAQADAAR